MNHGDQEVKHVRSFRYLGSEDGRCDAERRLSIEVGKVRFRPVLFNRGAHAPPGVNSRY